MDYGDINKCIRNVHILSRKGKNNVLLQNKSLLCYTKNAVSNYLVRKPLVLVTRTQTLCNFH